MRIIALIFLLLVILTASCKKDDDSPRQKRYLDYIVIEEAKLEAWDILNGPDMTLFYRDGVVDSTSLSGGSEFFEDVVDIMLPLTFEDVAFELTDYMDFQVIDVDEFAPDQIMYQLQFNPYEYSKTANPLLLSDADWTIKIFWKTQ
ncbi:MAG: hypothetical protein AB8F94_02500 [Saprospiraceae bacterium]